MSVQYSSPGHASRISAWISSSLFSIGVPVTSKGCRVFSFFTSDSIAFQVFVDQGDKYHVESCEPPVAGMESLIEALNTNNDFSAFVRAMRRRFKALCS